MNKYCVDSKAIGERIRQLRGDKTVNTVASALKISDSTLRMYESGERIPRDCTKIKIAQYFGITIEELFYSAD